MANKIRHYLTAFIAGELDPLLGARVDTQHYPYGLATCENWVPVNEGPLVKRPGFFYIRDADTTAAWLGAFRFSITQEYMVEWSALGARFYTNGGRIESDPDTPYEIATPYAAGDAQLLSTFQSYDRLYIDHPAYPPAALRRDSAATFAHEVLTLENGPFGDVNSDETVSLTVTGTMTKDGAVALTGALGFAAGHVGGLIYVEIEDLSAYNVWEPGMKGVAVNDYVRSAGKVYQATALADSDGITGQWQPVHTEGAEWDGQGLNDIANDNGPFGVKWQYVHDLWGIVEITAVAGSASASGTVKRRLPSTGGSLTTWQWAQGLFSAAAGWPSLVCLWNGRQVHLKNFDVVASVAGDFGGGRVNFSTRDDTGATDPDLAFRRTLQGEDPPLWVAVDRKLILGTATRELAIGPTNPQLAVSGDNIDAEPQSFYGSEQVYPVQAGTETVFVERGGRRVRAADYDFARDRYDAADFTATARHITRGGVIQLANQRTPYPLIWGVRGDGQLLVHPKSRADIKGWARVKLGGAAQVLSAVSIVGADGKTDELWLLVRRNRHDGAGKLEIWQQAPWRELGDAQSEAFFVDGGVRADADGGQTHFSNLTHLAGQAVAVLVNGAVVPNLTVANDGTLDIPSGSVPASDYTLIVGLAYTATAVALRPAAQFRGMWIHGLLQRVVKAVVRMLETAGLTIGAPGGTSEELVLRDPGDPMDAPIPLFSGDSDGLIEAAFDRDGQVTWISSDPLPAVVLGAMLDIDVDSNDA